MKCDLTLLDELSREIGLTSSFRNPNRLEIDLGGGRILCFINHDETLSLVAFEGSPWHAHDSVMFARRGGEYVELDYLGLLSGLSIGKVLVREEWREGKLVEMCLIHCDYNDVNDEFEYMQEGDEIRVVRPVIKKPARA